MCETGTRGIYIGAISFRLSMTITGLLLIGTLSGSVAASPTGGYGRANYVLPPEVRTTAVEFAGVRIPMERSEVHRRVLEQLNYLLMDRRSRLMEWFDRMRLYGPTIKKVLADEKVPADLLYLSVLLSDLNPAAKTRSGGVGWWALGSLKDKKNQASLSWSASDDWDDRRDPVLSTRIACATLKDIRTKKGNERDWLLAICAFVEGRDRVDEIMAKAKGFSYWDTVMPPYSEVLIPRLVALKLVDSNRAFYRVNVKPLTPPTYDFLGRLKLVKDLPLHIVAKWCGVTPRSMWEFNPGVSPTTGILPKANKKYPEGVPLRVPKGMGEKVRKQLIREGYLKG